MYNAPKNSASPKNENAPDKLQLIYSIVLHFILNNIFFQITQE